MKQHRDTAPTFTTFKVDTLWDIYKLLRHLGFGRFWAWHQAWNKIESRNKQMAEMCRGCEIEIEPQTTGEQQ